MYPTLWLPMMAYVNHYMWYYDVEMALVFEDLAKKIHFHFVGPHIYTTLCMKMGTSHSGAATPLHMTEGISLSRLSSW